jgi:hypothetical protein
MDKGDSFEGLDAWKAVMDVNLFGCVTVLRGSCVTDGLSFITQHVKCAAYFRPGMVIMPY